MAHFVCTRCEKTIAVSKPVWRCECGGLLDLDFQPVFDLKKIAARKPTLWRYREALPIDDDANIISFDEGYTPLLPLEFNGRTSWIKQDHLFPTGSYKDRGASVLISKIKELGINSVVEDSSGNAGCAVAAYCAKAGITCEIYVPASNSRGKLAQINLYGAQLNLVPGTREDTARAVWEAALARYYASHVWNPYFFHGTKTWAYEVCEQLGWRAPDVVVLPVGNGTLLLGASIGFNELHSAGIIQKEPRLIAVQTKNCAPLYAAFQAGQKDPAVIENLETLAEGIAIAEPMRGTQILQAVSQSGGKFLIVSEDQIEKILLLVSRMGFFIEPTSAAAIAGLQNYLQHSSTDELVVSVFTGHGLKATEKLLKIFEDGK